jgi:predicted AlkP superfamily pyrophosphatase or phosphodiesterase
MLRSLSVGLVIVASPLLSLSQVQERSRPALVVGIVIDQMRNDFIYRYWDRFSQGGFRKLITGGHYFRNAHYNFIPTYTGPGHSSIYTGATPRVHGIIGNDWYSKQDRATVSCVFDNTVSPVGTTADKGKMSPSKLMSGTIGDELRLASVGRSKVYSVALKDRGAVLPGGFSANGAFWYEATGNFVSSSWYMKELPGWLNEFNAKQLPRQYLQKEWQLLYNASTYSASLADENRYENKVSGYKPTFPYNYQQSIDAAKWSDLQYTPYGNSIVKDLAIACIKNEGLGKRKETDLLCISFSSTDVLGHETGPRSLEMEDMYLRLDKDIEELLSVLDKEVGKDNYILFLTADHGVSEIPNHLLDNKIGAGFAYRAVIRQQLRQFAQQAYGDSLIISSVSNEQVFLDELKIETNKLDKEAIALQLCEQLLKSEGIVEAYPYDVLKYGSFSQGDQRQLLQNGYNHLRSGHIAYLVKPNFIDHAPQGTSHGSGYNYDTHVPLVFYGWRIKKGETLSYTPITQIAPTICELLRIPRPSGCTASPLTEAIR